MDRPVRSVEPQPAMSNQSICEPSTMDMAEEASMAPLVPPPPSPHNTIRASSRMSTTSRVYEPKLGEAIKKFPSQQPGDLSLNVGDRVVITKYDPSRNWWRGYLERDRAQKGIFPKEFVKTLGLLEEFASPRGRAPKLPPREDGPPLLPGRDGPPALPPRSTAVEPAVEEQEQQAEEKEEGEGEEEEEEEHQQEPDGLTLVPRSDGAGSTNEASEAASESMPGEGAGAPAASNFIDTDGDGVANPWEGGLCFRGAEFATRPEPLDSMPKSFQNVGVFGMSEKHGMYCTAVPDSAELPKLPDGFAYDFVPRGHGYTVDRVGDPQNPLDNCRLMLNSCVCCVCCNECFEPRCCDLDALGENMARDPVDASNCHADMSLWQLVLELRFLPCYATLVSLPCWSAAEPCLDSCTICGPCLCGQTVESCLECIPCLDDLLKCQIPCFFSCWSWMPYSCKCRPCEGCRGRRCDPAAWCTGCACQCYVCTLIPACPQCCYNCPKCPRCPQVSCPRCPNCCPCLQSCSVPVETKLVCCGKQPYCGCLFRSHYCHPKTAMCLCCGKAVERVAGVHGEGWASPYLTGSNFHYKDHTDFMAWSDPNVQKVEEHEQGEHGDTNATKDVEDATDTAAMAPASVMER